MIFPVFPKTNNDYGENLNHIWPMPLVILSLNFYMTNPRILKEYLDHKERLSLQ